MEELESINSFSGAYAFLSNLEPSPIYYDVFSYPTVEHAFQAAKTLDMTERKTNFTKKQTPRQAKRNGRKINLRPDWEDVKVPIMYELLLLKFTTHPELASKLLATYPAILIEGNYGHDTFWGICDGVGLNMLGILLMNVRDTLRELACKKDGNDTPELVTYTRTLPIPTWLAQRSQITGEELYTRYGIKRGEKLCDITLGLNHEYCFRLEVVVSDNPQELPQICPSFEFCESEPCDVSIRHTVFLDEPESLYEKFEWLDKRSNVKFSVQTVELRRK